VVVLDIAAGQITSISVTVNPDKLAHLGPVGDLTSLPGRRDELRRCCYLAPCGEHVPASIGGTSMGTLIPHLVTRDPAVAAALTTLIAEIESMGVRATSAEGYRGTPIGTGSDRIPG
jgi:hypothetical protein